MDVTRITTSDGSRIEPPLNEDWDDLTKLEWKAAVTSADSGLRVKVTRGHRTTNGFPVLDAYNVVANGWGSPVTGFERAWDTMTGVQMGAMAATSEGLATRAIHQTEAIEAAKGILVSMRSWIDDYAVVCKSLSTTSLACLERWPHTSVVWCYVCQNVGRS